jgi:hypothetical protein
MKLHYAIEKQQIWPSSPKQDNRKNNFLTWDVMVMPTGPTGPPSLPPTPPQVHKDPTLPHHNTVQRCTNITDLILISHTSTQIHHAPKTLTHTSNDTYKRTPKLPSLPSFPLRRYGTLRQHPNISTTCTTQQCTNSLSSLISVDYPINTILSPPPHFSVWGGGQGKREIVRQIHTDPATVQKIETWK